MIILIIGVILGAVTVVFAVQNTEIVTYQFLAWSIDVTRSLVVIVVLFVGMLLGWAAGGFNRIRRRNKKNSE